MMKLKKLDPKVPYEKLVIEAEEFGKRNPLGFYQNVQNIIREAYENACRKIGIPIDTKLDHNLIMATTDDDIIFFSRADLIIYPGLKLDKYMEEII